MINNIMEREENRLRSFVNWPSNAGVEPRKVAKAGFYYEGQGVEVKCFSCGVMITDWNYGDRVVAVITRHKMLNPRCPFIVDPASSGNIPITSSRCLSDSTSGESERSRGSESSSDAMQTETSNGPSYSQTRTGSSPLCDPSSTTKDTYHTESSRLDSFQNWPVSYISPRQLAKAGFFYTGYSDKVECFFCGGAVESWAVGDCPFEEHRRHYPDCCYLASVKDGIHLRNSNNNSSTLYNGDYNDLKSLGVQKHRVPRSPKYSTFEIRLRSFKNWPPSIPQTPHQLADAGFYFTGRGDQVRCFHCDGGLRLWEAGDDPWQVHARWFSDCGYLFLVKGQQFIDQVLDSLRCHRPSSNKLEGRGVKRKQQGKKNVTDQQLQAAMSSPQALAALEVGLEVYRVKLAIKQRLESGGEMFSGPEDLIGAAVTLQSMEEQQDEPEEIWTTPPDSPRILGKTTRKDLFSKPGCSSSLRASPARDANFPSCASPSRNRTTESPTLSPAVTPSSSTDSFSECKKGENDDSESVANEKPLLQPTSNMSIGQLEDEVRRLKEWRQCKVCMDSEVGCVLLPCGHLVTCILCTYNLYDCPLCRQPIQATVRTYLS